MSILNLKDALNTSLTRTKQYIDKELAKKANSSHGTHVTYGGNGSATTVSRSDHTHNYVPLSTGSSITIHADNDSSSTGEYLLLKGGHNELKIASNAGGSTVTKSNTSLTFNGNVVYHAGNKPTPADIGAAASSHGTHLTLGTTSSTAYRGDYGNTAYTHSQAAHAPSNAQKNSDITKAEIEAKLTGAITTHTHAYAPTSHASTATTYGVSSASNYGHAMASGTTPKANGTAAVGSETAKFARGDHVHPLQTTVSGNAGTATKLATARKINGTSFDGSADITTVNWGTTRKINQVSVNGSADVKLPLDYYTCNIGSSNAKPYHHILTTGQCTGSYTDKSITIVLVNHYNSAGLGIAKATLRTNDAANGATASGELKWLVRSGFAEDQLCFNIRNTAKDAYMDVFYKATGTYNSLTWYVLTEGARGSHGAQWTKYNTHHDNGTNVYNETGMKAIRSYTATLQLAADHGAVNSAKTAAACSGNAATATKLATARTITIGNKANNFDGTGNISFTLSDIGAAGSSHGTHLTLGTGSGNAYRGDYGNTAYNHSQAAHAPSNAQKNSDITKAEIEAKLTGNITSHTHSAYAAASHGTHLTLGTGSGNAFRGDQGLAAYNHSQAAHAPSNAQKNSDITKAEIEAKLTGAITSHTHNYAGSSSAGGAANSATKLATARSINGTKFDGSANITTANWGTARTLTIGSKGQSVNGSGNVSWELSEIMGRASTTSSADTNKNKYTKFARVDISGGTYRSCTGTFDFVSVESGHVFGILTYYLRTGSAITSASISLAWKTLTNVAYANSVVAVKVSNGIFDLYYKPVNDWDTMSITNINSNGIGYITLYSNQSFTSSVTAAATSSLVNHSATAAKLTTARTITIGNSGKTFDGSGNVSWSLSDIGAAASSHGTHLTLGTTSSTAYRGDYGNTAYNHSQAAHAPSNAQKNSDITKAEIEAKLTGTITSHNHSGTYAAASHGTHLTIGTGASNAAAGNHTHNYAGSSSAGGAANSVKTNLIIKLNSGSTEGTNLFTFNGSTAKTINITPSAIGAAASSHGTHLTIGTGASNAAAGNHTHNYAGSSSAGGAATSANKVNTNLIIKLNGGSTEGTNLFTFNGSAAKTINITPSSIGAAASSHGTHLSLGTTSSTAYRGDYGNTAYQHSQAAHAPSNAQKNSDITKAEIEAKLTGTITSHNHSGTYAAASHGTHLTLGTTSSTAYRGDYGNTAYTHSQSAHAPSNAQKNSDITKAEIEAKLTGNITSHTHTAVNGYTIWTGSQSDYNKISSKSSTTLYFIK